MNLNKQIQETSDKIIAEKLPEMVEKATTKMLESIISDVFSSYGDMAKEIKGKIEKQLDINLQKFDTVDYNAIVAKAINENITQQVNIQPILDLTKNAIGFVEKKEINLSEIVEMFKNGAMEDSDEQQGSISVHVKENLENRWVEVSLDIEEDKDTHECGIKFIYSTNRNTIFSFKSQDYKSSLREVTPSKIVSLSTLEHQIFRLYSAQVKINTDDIEFDTEWYRYEY